MAVATLVKKTFHLDWLTGSSFGTWQHAEKHSAGEGVENSTLFSKTNRK